MDHPELRRLGDRTSCGVRTNNNSSRRRQQSSAGNVADTEPTRRCLRPPDGDRLWLKQNRNMRTSFRIPAQGTKNATSCRTSPSPSRRERIYKIHNVPGLHILWYAPENFPSLPPAKTGHECLVGGRSYDRSNASLKKLILLAVKVIGADFLFFRGRAFFYIQLQASFYLRESHTRSGKNMTRDLDLPRLSLLYFSQLPKVKKKLFLTEKSTKKHSSAG